MGEKSAGNNDNGAVDLVWVNAENFRTMKQANLLYGPFPEKLPSAKFVTWDDTKITDAGFPTDGYEMPLWTCHALFAYDSAKVPKPPTTWDELFKWIKDNPGQFTHPVSSDFVGSYFIRQACMNATGGYKQYLGAFEQTLFNKNFSTCWDKLNEIKGSFWRNGKTYPEASPAMYGLLGQGEIAIAPCTCQNCVQSRIDTGQFPKTARTLIIRGATETACNFAAIPYNSPHLAAALVTADLLMSPDGQYTAAVEHRQFPVIDVALLSPEWQAKFKALDYGPGFLPVNVLQADAVPMIPSSWWVPIEDGWRKNVQQK
jgi:putative spermidine/putrescine transport system substrate-binding protein